MGWKTMLTYITGLVDQELLSRNEYLCGRESHSSKSDPRPVRACGAAKLR